MTHLQLISPSHTHRMHTHQRGATLIELMVGITIGLLTITVAMGALTLSRGVSGTVSDASLLQQQASYAFRVMGQQLRQAGSMRLNLAVAKNAGDPIDPADLVAFAPDPAIRSAVYGVAPTTPPIAGNDSPTTGQYKMSVAFQNYVENTVSTPAGASLLRDCLGSQPSATIIRSQFVLENGELRCAGTDNTAQTILRNVADFQVNYLVQSNAASGNPTIKTVNAATASTDWTTVFGTEVCLVLYGDELINTPDGSTYNDCNGTAVNMSSTGALSAARKNRMHMTFRNVFQLRSQGIAS